MIVSFDSIKYKVFTEFLVPASIVKLIIPEKLYPAYPQIGQIFAESMLSKILNKDLNPLLLE